MPLVQFNILCDKFVMKFNGGPGENMKSFLDALDMTSYHLPIHSKGI